jgi:hypothetical protein
MTSSRYTFFPPKTGWIEQKPKEPTPTEPPRKCNFKDIDCPGNRPCTGCEHDRPALK